MQKDTNVMHACNLGVSYGQSTITPRKRTYSNSNNLIHSERLSSHKKPKSGAVSSLFNNVSEDVKLKDDHDMYMWHPELPSLLSDNTNADSNMNDVHNIEDIPPKPMLVQIAEEPCNLGSNIHPRIDPNKVIQTLYPEMVGKTECQVLTHITTVKKRDIKTLINVRLIWKEDQLKMEYIMDGQDTAHVCKTWIKNQRKLLVQTIISSMFYIEADKLTDLSRMQSQILLCELLGSIH